VILTDAAATAWPAHLPASSAPDYPITIVDCGPVERRNAAITKLELAPRLASDWVATVELSASAGDEPSLLQLTLDDRVVHEQLLAGRGLADWRLLSVPIPPSTHPFGVLGAHLTPAGTDVLSADNRRTLRPLIPGQTDLWLCSSDAGGSLLPASLTFLHAACTSLAATFRRPAFVVHTIDPDELLAITPGPTNLLLLADPPARADLWPILGQHLAAGTGIWLFAGPNMAESQSPELAELLEMDLDGLARPSSPVHLQLTAGGRGRFPELADRGDLGLFAAEIWQYLRIRPRADADVLWEYDDGNPAIVLRRVGPGLLLLCTTTADTRWNDLPTYGDFTSLIGLLLEQALAWTCRQSVAAEPDIPPEESEIVRISDDDLAKRLPGRQLELIPVGRFRPSWSLPARGDATRLAWLLLFAAIAGERWLVTRGAP
jgi:hypothetical protein